MEFSILGGGVYPIFKTFFREKSVFFVKNTKMIRMVTGGVRAESTALPLNQYMQHLSSMTWDMSVQQIMMACQTILDKS